MLQRNHGSLETIVQKVREEVPRLIDLKREWTYWDFKREWHTDNTDLLHDIICMANNLDRELAYIVIGVDEENDFLVNDLKTGPQNNRKNTQQLNDFLSKVSWANGCWPFVLVETLELCEGSIDVIAIMQSREDMPYCLSKKNGAIRAYALHSRRGDSNSPIDTGISWNEMSSLWAHHFALDSSPLEKAQRFLVDKENWLYLSNYGLSSDRYYRYAPEYTICETPEDDLDGYEYYMLNQYDPKPHWYQIAIKYFQTTLFDCQGIALDGGRYFSPIPERSFLACRESTSIELGTSYCYFIEGSLEWNLNQFFYSEDSGEEQSARSRFFSNIIIFKSEEEKIEFERIVLSSSKELESRIQSMKDPHGVERLPRDYTDEGKAHLLREMKQVAALKEMLEEVRIGSHKAWYLPTSQKW